MAQLGTQLVDFRPVRYRNLIHCSSSPKPSLVQEDKARKSYLIATRESCTKNPKWPPSVHAGMTFILRIIINLNTRPGVIVTDVAGHAPRVRRLIYRLTYLNNNRGWTRGG